MNKKEKTVISPKRAKNASKNDYEKELIEKLETGENNVVKPAKKTRRITKKKNSLDYEYENDMVTRNYDLSLFEVVIIIFITGILVSIASGVIVYNNYHKLSNNINSNPTIDQLESDEPLETLENNYKYIINNYVGEVDNNALIEAAIEAMYKELGDDYSYYMDEEDSQDLYEKMTGQYQGVGIEIMSSFDGEKYTSIVNRVFDDSPAQEAGIQVGDILLELDGVTLSDKDPNYLPNIVKYGESDTHTLKVLRNSEEINITLTRKLVYINSVTGKVIDGVGYISIDTFSETTVDQVKKYIDEFDKSVKSLVVDLRDNSGGTLDSAYQLSDLFIEKNKNIYQYKDKSGEAVVYKAVDGIYREFDKIVVLINENSASASEVLSLALKESADAKIVGVKSFGKGTVQTTKRLTNGKTTKITVAYWLSPSGKTIDKVGIEPDVVVEDVNIQLNEAIKLAK